MTICPSYHREYVRKATKEELIAHFTKKDKMEKKTLIGYKAPCDLYGGDVKAGTIFKKGRSGSAFWYQPINREGDSQVVPQEIVETWEPAYKEDRIEKIELYSNGGKFELEVSAKGICYKPEDAWLHIDSLRRIVNEANGQKDLMACEKQYPVSYTHVNLGCKKSVPIVDIKEVLTAYDRLKHDTK
jgi:hypothetical protein